LRDPDLDDFVDAPNAVGADESCTPRPNIDALMACCSRGTNIN